MRHLQLPQPSQRRKRVRAGALMALLQHLSKSCWNGQDMQALFSNCKIPMVNSCEWAPAPAGSVAVRPIGLVRGDVLFTLLSTPRDGTRHNIVAAHQHRVHVDQSPPKPQRTPYRLRSCANPSSGHVSHTPIQT